MAFHDLQIVAIPTKFSDYTEDTALRPSLLSRYIWSFQLISFDLYTTFRCFKRQKGSKVQIALKSRKLCRCNILQAVNGSHLCAWL